MELLDLSDVTERDTITLPGGAVREVIRHSDLGIYEIAHLSQLQARVQDAEKNVRAGKMTAANEKQLLKLLGDTVKFLIPSITPAELAKLTRAHREQIVLVWIGRNSEQSATGGDEGNARRPRTGGGSSRVSKRSTGATRKAGSTTRRG